MHNFVLGRPSSKILFWSLIYLLQGPSYFCYNLLVTLFSGPGKMAKHDFYTKFLVYSNNSCSTNYDYSYHTK